MAGRGPAPKNPNTVQRRNVPERAVELGEGDASAAPDMPEAPEWLLRDEERGWLEATVEWWLTWAGSPQASQFGATAWQRLKMLMPVVDHYHATADLDSLKEIRLQEKMLGATPEDLQRLRWELPESDVVEVKAPAKRRRKTSKASARARLKSVS